MTADIRLVTVDDTAEITALVTQNLDFLAPWDPLRSADYTSEPTQRQLIIDALERHAAGTSIPLVIIEAGSVVGRINVTDIVRGVFESAHLGYWVSQEHNGRGVASTAVAATVSLAFERYKLHRLQAGTLVHNLRSQRVLQRNGFTLIGRAPRYLRIAGEWQDHLLFQRTSDQRVSSG